jgi:predicted metal-dependent phosphoesterase TrpH
MIADLHCHSRISDGSLSIRELVSLAKRIGINVLAIADHDTVDGLKKAAQECQKQGIKNIPAVEISAYDYERNRKAHILGYLMDQPQDVGRICKPMLDQRQEVSKWMWIP